MLKDNEPIRRCVGCMESKPKRELVRVACYEGQVSLDPTGKAKGRGAYICKENAACFRKALKKRAFARAFHMEVDAAQLEEIGRSLYGGE